jgi:hypothetical protein
MPRDFVREHDVVGAEAGRVRAVVGIVVLEISDEARGGELDLDASSARVMRLNAAASRSSFSMRPPGTNQVPCAGRFTLRPTSRRRCASRTSKSKDTSGACRTTKSKVSWEST